MSVELLEREFNNWASELEDIKDSFETSRKKNIQVLKKKRDSIEKLKQKLQTNQNEPELTKLLAGMIKDYETKSGPPMFISNTKNQLCQNVIFCSQKFT